MIKAVKSAQGDSLLYRDEGRGVYYRRVVGGLGWPEAQQPGFLVVLAEELRPEASLQARRLRVVGELAADTLGALHKGCIGFRKLYQANVWTTDCQNCPEMSLWLRQNQALAPEATIYLTQAAPATAKVQMILQLLKDLMQPSRKILHFGPDGTLPGYLLALAPGDLQEQSRKYPALAALGYAVAEMVLHEPLDQGRTKPQAITTWNPYNLGA